MGNPERADRGSTLCCGNLRTEVDQNEDVRVETCKTCHSVLGLYFTWHTNFGGQFDAK